MKLWANKTMIFTKKFDDISFEDIQSLVENGIRESVVLDYKGQIPKNEELIKLISAFANTYGGLIVFGVETEKATNKPQKIVGLHQTEKNQENTIENTCYDSITPPVFVESGWFESKDGKSVFLIRVPESDLTPHAVDNNSIVYVRTMSQKRPLNSKADLDRQEWLKKRREKSVRLREELTARASDAGHRHVTNYSTGAINVTTRVVPLFPRKHLVELTNMDAFLQLSSGKYPEPIQDYYLDTNDRRPINDGYCWPRKSNNGHSYTELNIFGLYFNICCWKDLSLENKLCLQVTKLTQLFIRNLFLVHEFWVQAQLRNRMSLYVKVSGTKNTKLCFSNESRSPFITLEGRSCREVDFVEWEEEIDFPCEERIFKLYIVTFLERLFHVYGVQENYNKTAISFYDYVYGLMVESKGSY